MCKKSDFTNFSAIIKMTFCGIKSCFFWKQWTLMNRKINSFILSARLSADIFASADGIGSAAKKRWFSRWLQQSLSEECSYEIPSPTNCYPLSEGCPDNAQKLKRIYH